ncbi:MAG: 16S rRNA (cytidine(1402)-2'-O)-methyltransferase [Acidimicrobiia bacterium]|nr:16S rRNA (cytidine(1402)-2'-O)-methyltransferase [Acidimicrobiia bacterium]MDX2467821.1 16S rRNA (cytidine(1402)-2'-O)-methyltransferase [Acidimicrobiia bacterium]
MPGKLILCGTPIGNLSDVSTRLHEALLEADLVYAEDTRRAGILLGALGVRTVLRSYFVGNEARRAEELQLRLEAGETVALITDAGMPSIADPGLTAVQAAIAADAVVTVVPGPSAVTAALALSGLPAERFVFEGFLPRKGKDRTKRLGEVADEKRTVVLFSAKSRVVSDIKDLAAALGSDREIVVTRELTKVFEEVWRGTLAVAAEHWAAEELRGEFTLVIGGAAQEPADLDRVVAETLNAIESGESMADAVRRIASESGVSRRELYEVVLRTKTSTSS